MCAAPSYCPHTLPYYLHLRQLHGKNQIAYAFPSADQSITWDELWRQVRQLAGGLLQAGIRKGDRVAMLMPARIELIVSLYATAWIGAVCVPLNTYSKKDELLHYLQAAEPKLLLLSSEGQHQNYLEMMSRLLEETQSLDSANEPSNGPTPIPSRLVVLDAPEDLPAPFSPYEALFESGAEVDPVRLEQAAEALTPSDSLVLLFTSGTLGLPKGVARTTASFLPAGRSSQRPRRVPGWITRGFDSLCRRFSLFSLLPLYHMGGFGSLLINLTSVNVPLLLISHFNPMLALQVLDRAQPKLMLGTPFMLQKLLAMPNLERYNLSSLLGVVFSSSAVNGVLVRKLLEAFRLRFFIVSYGSSEAGAVSNGACFVEGGRTLFLSAMFELLKRLNLFGGLLKEHDFLNQSHSLGGKVEKGVQVRIADISTGQPLPPGQEGEVWVRSHRVMRYWASGADPAGYTEDGWYRSGDLGFLDKLGYLTLTGRQRRVISRGGEKISPAEIEYILHQHPEVDDACVVGVPDEWYGEQVCACVVKRPGSTITEEALVRDISPRLSSFKHPRYVLFLEQLPMAATGKVPVAQVRQLAEETLRERERERSMQYA